MQLSIRPLTDDSWQAFERLFGEKGACGGCWCMWWRLTASQYDQQKGRANRQAMRQLVRSGADLGLLDFDGETAVGWCAVSPRQALPRLSRSRILKPIDDSPVWSVVCFFVDKNYRGCGVSGRLLEAAKDWVAAKGGTILEGYPVEPKQQRVPPLFVYTGLDSVFRQAGFEEVARRSPTRPLMRCDLCGPD